MTQNYTTVVGESAATAAARAEIERLTKELDVLRAAIFGGGNYDPDLRNGNFAEMAQELHAAQKGGLERAEKAEAERDEALAQVAAAYEAAALVCEDYPCSAPDYDEWKLYDEQIEHSQRRIRALTPADAKAALESYGREKMRAGMKRAADLVPWDNKDGLSISAAILAEMETLK